MLIHIDKLIKELEKRKEYVIIVGEACDLYEKKFKEQRSGRLSIVEAPLRYASAVRLRSLGSFS